MIIQGHTADYVVTHNGTQYGRVTFAFAAEPAIGGEMRPVYMTAWADETGQVVDSELAETLAEMAGATG